MPLAAMRAARRDLVTANAQQSLQFALNPDVYFLARARAGEDQAFHDESPLEAQRGARAVGSSPVPIGPPRKDFRRAERRQFGTILVAADGPGLAEPEYQVFALRH